MAQVVAGAVGPPTIEGINEIFTPGKAWSDSTGLIYDVEEP